MDPATGPALSGSAGGTSATAPVAGSGGPVSAMVRLSKAEIQNAPEFSYERSARANLPDRRAPALPTHPNRGGARPIRQPRRCWRQASPGARAWIGERVQAALERRSERRVDEPVTLDPALALEGAQTRYRSGSGFRRPRASRHGRRAGATRRHRQRPSARKRCSSVAAIQSLNVIRAHLRTGLRHRRHGPQGPCPLVPTPHNHATMDLNSPLFDRIRIKPSCDEPQRGARAGLRASGLQAGRASTARPRGADSEGQYWRFCLEHVREYNASYNYFAGMSDDAVAAYQKDAVIGHRPTWAMGVNAAGERRGEGAAGRRRATGPTSIRSASCAARASARPAARRAEPPKRPRYTRRRSGARSTSSASTRAPTGRPSRRSTRPW